MSDVQHFNHFESIWNNTDITTIIASHWQAKAGTFLNFSMSVYVCTLPEPVLTFCQLAHYKNLRLTFNEN